MHVDQRNVVSLFRDSCISRQPIADVAKAYIAQLDQAHVFRKAIVTRIEPGRTFYPAEAYHQDFLQDNPNYPYIVDLPKMQDLKHIFPDMYRTAPVLVARKKSSR
jgi:peptide-methionine (S)-S-oxide reductase